MNNNKKGLKKISILSKLKCESKEVHENPHELWKKIVKDINLITAKKSLDTKANNIQE